MRPRRAGTGPQFVRDVGEAGKSSLASLGISPAGPRYAHVRSAAQLRALLPNSDKARPRDVVRVGIFLCVEVRECRFRRGASVVGRRPLRSCYRREYSQLRGSCGTAALGCAEASTYANLKVHFNQPLNAVKILLRASATSPWSNPNSRHDFHAPVRIFG
jgi:hypothetical protein